MAPSSSETLFDKVRRRLDAARMLDLPAPAADEADENVVHVGAFSIVFERRTFELASIVGPRTIERDVYAIEAVTVSGGTYMDPPDVDVIEMGVYERLDAAIVALLSMILLDRMPEDERAEDARDFDN